MKDHHHGRDGLGSRTGPGCSGAPSAQERLEESSQGRQGLSACQVSKSHLFPYFPISERQVGGIFTPSPRPGALHS